MYRCKMPAALMSNAPIITEVRHKPETNLHSSLVQCMYPPKGIYKRPSSKGLTANIPP